MKTTLNLSAQGMAVIPAATADRVKVAYCGTNYSWSELPIGGKFAMVKELGRLGSLIGEAYGKLQNRMTPERAQQKLIWCVFSGHECRRCSCGKRVCGRLTIDNVQ